mmetsp:Transcript_116436/g.202508  ORF Transcript_116436/g.202508 Transcript_116436/m.202508 type:complete len:211 (-) Transcript_116436:1148-1780(-)
MARGADLLPRHRVERRRGAAGQAPLQPASAEQARREGGQMHRFHLGGPGPVAAQLHGHPQHPPRRSGPSVADVPGHRFRVRLPTPAGLPCVLRTPTAGQEPLSGPQTQTAAHGPAHQPPSPAPAPFAVPISGEVAGPQQPTGHARPSFRGPCKPAPHAPTPHAQQSWQLTTAGHSLGNVPTIQRCPLSADACALAGGGELCPQAYPVPGA